jgi:hypothetical protein
MLKWMGGLSAEEIATFDEIEGERDLSCVFNLLAKPVVQ